MSLTKIKISVKDGSPFSLDTLEDKAKKGKEDTESLGRVKVMAWVW